MNQVMLTRLLRELAQELAGKGLFFWWAMDGGYLIVGLEGRGQVRIPLAVAAEREVLKGIVLNFAQGYGVTGSGVETEFGEGIFPFDLFDEREQQWLRWQKWRKERGDLEDD